MKNTSLPLLLLLLTLQNCSPVEKRQPEIKMTDPHSFSMPGEARVTHLQWKADVDFKTHVIQATATWEIKRTGDADVIILDTKGLNIHKVTLDNNKPAEFRLGQLDSLLGRALAILIHPNTRAIKIEYETTPNAEALQWLEPSQTAGKTQPFL
ncbi:MAG TPA: hypothetical protein VK666_26190, partial [Chryseolinea sp.]|nr:hypothetical protein [Chryseolinea sp.]